MEAASGVASSRGGSLTISSSRKEWRAVSEQHPVRNTEDEKLERRNMGQPDERTIYEQRIHEIARQREELQHMELELKARIVARSEIMVMRDSFSAQIKEHEDEVRKLQDQFQEKEQIMDNMERRMEEKDRELNAIKRDKEDSWVKEDLIREQNKELATFRRERDHSEAERAQYIQQIHDLREHLQEKDQQIHELQEQHRVDQETIYLKDEQLKAWVERAQELDTLQSTTNHSLQAELRDRVEQYNQLWLGCQRQFAEMERLHLHTVHQLQVELADAREKSGAYSDDSRLSQTNSKDEANTVQNSGKELDANGTGVISANNGLHPNSHSDHVSSLTTGNVSSNQINNVAGLPIAPSSLFGMPTFLPPGQVAALHPFIVHQQGIPLSMPSYSPQAHGQFHSMPTASSFLQGQQKQVVSENAQLPRHNQQQSPETDHDTAQPDAKYEYGIVNNGQGLHPDYLQFHINHGQEPESIIASATGDTQVVDSVGRGYLVSSKSEQSMVNFSSQFNDNLKLSTTEQNDELKEQKATERKMATDEQGSAATLLPDVPNYSVSFAESVTDNGSSSVSSEVFLTMDQSSKVAAGKASDAGLLDKRALLACIVRTMPAGGRIRINSTLPNRLGKMLAPLHWHDYKKKYGKLEDFVASHPELFLIEGDFIQLREGAQEMIAATAAVAKVAAVTSRPYSSSMPSVAVTPLARPYRLKKVSSIDSGVSNGIGGVGGIQNLKFVSRPDMKDSKELNGSDFGRTSKMSAQSKGLIHGTANLNFIGNQQGRAAGAALPSRR